MSITRAQAVINGKPLVFETGKLAEQAGGAVTVRYGDTIVFAAATVSPTIRPGIDFFPLTVDFEERLYAAGKIPGSFPRREGRPSEEGILTARLTDRPIRPLFPKGFRNDVQIVVSPFSADQENEPDILSVNAASAALAISNAPFDGPIGCVRVGTVDGTLTLNPTIQELETSELDFVIAGTRDSIMMLEAGANQVTEERFVEALRLAQPAIAELITAQEALVRAVGKPKIEWTPEKVDPAKEARVAEFFKDRIRGKVRNPDKAQREVGLDELKREGIAALVSRGGSEGGVAPSDSISEADVSLTFDALTKPPASNPWQTGVQTYRNYYAQSAPGGRSFGSPLVVSSAASNPDGSSYNDLTEQFIGDYIGIVDGPDTAYLAWTDARAASKCAAVDRYRNEVYAGQKPVPPNPDNACPQSFGNTDSEAGVVNMH